MAAHLTCTWTLVSHSNSKWSNTKYWTLIERIMALSTYCASVRDGRLGHVDKVVLCGLQLEELRKTSKNKTKQQQKTVQILFSLSHGNFFSGEDNVSYPWMLTMFSYIIVYVFVRLSYLFCVFVWTFSVWFYIIFQPSSKVFGSFFVAVHTHADVCL